MKDFNNIQIISVKVTAKGQSNIGECIRESAILSLEENVNVKLWHDGTEYKLLFNDLMACINKSEVK